MIYTFDVYIYIYIILYIHILTIINVLIEKHTYTCVGLSETWVP